MILAITGQMRSGTSAMAEAVHMLGCPVARTILPPYPPAWRAEWEDVELSTNMMDPHFCDLGWLTNHFEERARVAKTLYKSDHFAIKSPFLALNHDLIQFAADQQKQELRWVIMERNQATIDASRENYPWLQEEWNEDIRDELPEIQGPAYIMEYEYLVAEPMKAIQSLADWAGLPSERLFQVASYILQPTTYA